MAVDGAELVGGETALHDKLKEWGYMSQPGVSGINDAVALYEQMHKPALDPLSNRIHGRDLIPDDSIGPVVADTINSRRCSVSDFHAVEEANWPDACRNDISVSWNFSRMPGLDEMDTLQAWRHLVDHPRMYNRMFALRLNLVPGEYPHTRIYAALKALPGSTLAWSYLAANSCAFRAQQAYDSTIRWSLNLAKGTVGHEVGHALGMNHTPQDRNSLMYPSMNGQLVLNQTDINNMKQLGYQLRPDPGPTPVPPEPGDWEVKYYAKGFGIRHKQSGDEFMGRIHEISHDTV